MPSDSEAGVLIANDYCICNEVWDIATKICYGLPISQHVVSQRMQLPCRYVGTTASLWWVRVKLITCLVKLHALKVYVEVEI